jgi:hypothetical protein
MSKVVLKKPAQLMGVVRKVSDKTMNLRFNTDESSSEELAIWDGFAGMTGYLAFSLDNIQEEDIPVEDTEFQAKTPSQRLRGCIFRLFEQEESQGNFNDYYNTYMEKIMNVIKNKLDN